MIKSDSAWKKQSRKHAVKNGVNGAAVRVFIMLAAFVAFAVVAFAHSKDDNLNNILKKMEEAKKRIDTLRVDYARSIFFEFTKEKHEVSGTLFFKKPNSIYINQSVPQEQRIYIDGENMTIYVPENRQAIIGNWKNFIYGDFVLAVVMNLGSRWREIKGTNIVSFGGENEKYIVIKVNPMEKKGWNIKIYVSKATMYPGKAVIKADGIREEIMFKSYTLNPALNKDIFKFNASGIEVIKLN
jgi:outer membrane lipoprotein carrier protein